MSSTDPNLGLNYGWTLGESGWDTGMDANLKRLGAVVGLSVKDRDLTTPPASPTNGDRYLIPAAATGLWAGKTNQIAVRIADASCVKTVCSRLRHGDVSLLLKN